MAKGATAPSRKKMFTRGLTGRCAVCGKVRVRPAWLSVTPDCPRCNFKLERKDGHFVGAVGINTIVTFGFVLIAVIVGTAVTAPDIPAGRLSLIIVPLAVAVSIGFYPISKLLWSAIDVMMVPIEPGEVDPRWDPSVELD